MLISSEGVVKFSDFGLARFICPPKGKMTKNICTL